MFYYSGADDDSEHHREFYFKTKKSKISDQELKHMIQFKKNRKFLDRGSSDYDPDLRNEMIRIYNRTRIVEQWSYYRLGHNNDTKLYHMKTEKIVVCYKMIFAIIKRVHTNERKRGISRQADTIFEAIDRKYFGISQYMVRNYLTIYRQLNYDVGTGVVGTTATATATAIANISSLSIEASASPSTSMSTSLSSALPSTELLGPSSSSVSLSSVSSSLSSALSAPSSSLRARNINVETRENNCVVRKLWLCPSSSTGRSRSIQKIHISKNAKFLEYKPTNGITNPSNNTILKINDKKWTELPIHPVTDSNSDQSRPRHLTTPEMIKHLDPICLDRTIGLNIYNDGRIFESSADVVQITFDSNGRTNHVLYASDSSDSNHLKDAYQLWNKYEEEIRRLLHTVPLEALIRDELAGGCYGE